MKRMALIVVVAGLVCLAGRAEQTYEVRLTRPEQVGESCWYKCKAVATQSMKLYRDAKAEQPARDQTETTETTLIGTREVTGVDDKGNAVEVKFTVDSFTVLKEGKTELLLDKGTVVTGKVVAEGKEYSVAGKPVSEELAGSLDQTMGLERNDGASDDEAFGTSTPQPVGASWDANVAAMAKDLSKLGTQVDPANVEGKTTLAKVVTFQGVQCLQFICEAKVKSLACPAVPPGFTQQGASMQMNVDTLLPAGTTGQSLAQRVRLRMAFDFVGAPNTQVAGTVFKMSMEANAETNRRPLEK